MVSVKHSPSPTFLVCLHQAPSKYHLKVIVCGELVSTINSGPFLNMNMYRKRLVLGNEMLQYDFNLAKNQVLKFGTSWNICVKTFNWVLPLLYFFHKDYSNTF